MKPVFQVSISSVTPFDQCTDVWTTKDQISVLHELGANDLAGLSDDEIMEMCLLELQEHEPAEAAAILLKLRMGDVLSAGKIQHLSNEMLDEKLWEEYADINLHESFYEVAMLLHAAFPGDVPEPDAITVALDVVASNGDGKTQLKAPVDESWLIRLVTDGMEEDCLLMRLFDEQIRGVAFPEASQIIWSLTSTETNDGLSITLKSSQYFFGDVEADAEYSSTAMPDAVTRK